MLRALIVDDEPIVREGLKNIIAWEEYGFEICGEGIDGRDGLNKIISLNPDLVLMDIKMPGVNGIDVIKNAKEAGYNGKCIMLTGYSDFEYAKSSIRLGVNSYLLKPIDEDELIDTVKKLYKDIQKERNVEKQIINSKKYIKEDVINTIINGIKELDSIQADINVCNLKLSFDSFQIAIVDAYLNNAEERVHLSRHVEDFFKDYKDIDIVYKDHEAILLIKGTSSLKAERFLERLYKGLALKVKPDINIVLGRTVNSIYDVQASYMDCKDLLKKKFFYDTKIMCRQNINKESSSGLSKKSLNIYANDIYTYVDINDVEKIEQTLRSLQLYFVNSGYSPEKIKGICVNIFAGLKDKIILNYEKHKDIALINEEIIQSIYDKSTLTELMNYLKEELVRISTKICNDSSDNVMKRILNYIEKNYYKDIKLEGLSEIFNYNSAYLGKMFKNYTGENFNSHIDKIRIENAKVLLTNKELKVYQVSEKVGYKNIDYFYGKFKKYVGISPKEFKKEFNVSNDIISL